MSIRQGLLALLSDEPKYGYQLKTEFESATGGMWPVNVGQVYTTLDRLVRDGFVEADEREEQKRYKLTLDGYHQVGRWWQAVPEEEPPPRDELMVKVLLAIATTPDKALDVVTAQRTAVFELLQQRRRSQRRAMADGASTAHQLADDALVVRAEADLRWLDLCEARIQAAPGGSAQGELGGRGGRAGGLAFGEGVGPGSGSGDEDGVGAAPAPRRRPKAKGKRT